MKELQHFIDLVKTDAFGKAHEALERQWHYHKKQNNELESKVLKGFINGATSLELFRRGRVEPSQRVWNTFKKYEQLIPQVSTFNMELILKIQKLLYEKRAIQLSRV